MIFFCYFCQKSCFWLWVWPIWPLFCANWTQKKQFFRGFTIFFPRTIGLQHKLLILIESTYIFHSKSQKKGKWVWFLVQNNGQIRPNVMKKQRNWHFNRVFFHIFHELYIWKQKVVGIEIPEWKLKTKLARNTIFNGN